MKSWSETIHNRASAEKESADISALAESRSRLDLPGQTVGEDGAGHANLRKSRLREEFT